MSTPVTDRGSQNQAHQNNGTSVHPVVPDPQMRTVLFTPPSSQQWVDSPPAYETLTDLPLWCVPPTGSQLNSSVDIPQWRRPPPDDASLNVPAWSAPPDVFLINVPPIAQQQNTPPTTHVSNVSANAITWTYRTVNTNADSVAEQDNSSCKTKAPGCFLVLAAFMQFGSGIALSDDSQNLGSLTLSCCITYWAPFFYLITGIFTAVACARDTFNKAKCVIFLNFISLVLSCVGLVLNILDLQVLKCSNELYFQPICNVMFSNSYTIFCVVIASNVLVIFFSILAACVIIYILQCTSGADPTIRTLSLR